MNLFDQLPRLSAYDPGATGEGGLDPLGLSAVADRIADVMAPGIRARMSLPRFVTVSAVGAIAYQQLHGVTADDGKTTVDITFEWLVVEAIVRNPGNGRQEGVPGNSKAARAKAAHERLSKRNYLNGPRVFGFTGVYRPFSRDVGVLTTDDFPAENAMELVNAWERDLKLPGFVDGVPGTTGGQLRKEIADACKEALRLGECAAPPTGQLLRSLAAYLAPREAQTNERRVLRKLISQGNHEIRNELSAKLIATPLEEDISQRDLAHQLLPNSSILTRRALQASIDYEEAATALDVIFRRFLVYTTQQSGSVISQADALRTPELATLAPRIGALVRKAITSVGDLEDLGLFNETLQVLRLFDRSFTTMEFFEALVERHEEVQARRKKLPWLDQFDGDWTVRTPYRNQNSDLSEDRWVHPMRLATLAKFIAETA